MKSDVLLTPFGKKRNDTCLGVNRQQAVINSPSPVSCFFWQQFENTGLKYYKNILKPLDNFNGSVLVMIIISIIVIASISAAMLTGTSTVTFTQLGSVDTMNGYFLAETGKTYATSYLINEMKIGGDPDTATTGTMALLNKEFTIPKTTSSFIISLSHSYCDGSNSGDNDCPCPGYSCTYHLQVTGKPNSSAERTVTYIIQQDM